jgi:hypothetical protein
MTIFMTTLLGIVKLAEKQSTPLLVQAKRFWISFWKKNFVRFVQDVPVEDFDNLLSFALTGLKYGSFYSTLSRH